MGRVRITVMRITTYPELSARYENPLEHPCDMAVGQVFETEGLEKPAGFCESAWQTLLPFVMTLSCGGSDIYQGWMKNKRSAMVSCNDGFRPVSFYLEAIDA
jgi:uncharacterized repeat protein (TIGR04076 family)